MMVESSGLGSPQLKKSLICETFVAQRRDREYRSFRRVGRARGSRRAHIPMTNSIL